MVWVAVVLICCGLLAISGIGKPRTSSGEAAGMTSLAIVIVMVLVLLGIIPLFAK